MNEPLCRECRRNGRVVAADMVDHIRSIKLGGSRFDASNLQSLCDACHARKRQQESRAAA